MKRRGRKPPKRKTVGKGSKVKRSTSPNGFIGGIWNYSFRDSWRLYEEPRHWGDRLIVAGEAEDPLRVLHEQISVERLSSDQLSALEAFAHAMVQQQGERT